MITYAFLCLSFSWRLARFLLCDEDSTEFIDIKTECICPSRQNASVHQEMRYCHNKYFFFIPFIIFFSFLLSHVFLYLWDCVVIIFLHIFSIIKKIFWVCKISSNKIKNTTIIIILLLYYFSCLAFLSIFQKM